MTGDNNSKVVELTYAPTICRGCHKKIIKTYLIKGDPDIAKEVYVICGTCMETLPMTIREWLKRPIEIDIDDL